MLRLSARRFTLLVGLLPALLPGCTARRRPAFDVLREIVFRRDADSLSMEVTHYSGKRRIYRVLLTRSGYIRFNPGIPYPDSVLPVPPPQIDSVSRQKFYDLAGFADAVGFAAMPPDISENPQACGPETINNFPTVIVAFYLRDRVIQVVDYHGCFWAPEALRDFEANIAEATGVARWTRAASDSTERPHN